MDAVSSRSIITIAAIQAGIAAAALLSSPVAGLAAGAIGALALGRYISVASFARSIGRNDGSLVRVLTVSAWMLGFAALLAAVAATAIRAKPALPWALAAAFAGPFGMSIFALGSGIGALASSRARRVRSALPGGSR